jgi:hypothetical protein
MESAAPDMKSPAIRRLVRFDPAAAGDVGAADFVFDAPGVEAVAAECAGIVLTDGNAMRAATLLAIGAPCVFLGQAALLDSALVERLAAAHGGARIGIHAPVKRQGVSWSFETVSNADFKTVAPSFCEPAWEVLKADGTPTGTLAAWWLAAMRDLGATHFLVRADIGDDTDLNICAGLVEEFGDALWLGPLDDPAPVLADWVAFGRCRQLALPAGFAMPVADGSSALPAVETT